MRGERFALALKHRDKGRVKCACGETPATNWDFDSWFFLCTVCGKESQRFSRRVNPDCVKPKELKWKPSKSSVIKAKKQASNLFNLVELLEDEHENSRREAFREAIFILKFLDPWKLRVVEAQLPLKGEGLTHRKVLRDYAAKFDEVFEWFEKGGRQ